MHIRESRRGEEEALVALWLACGLTRPWNDPYKDIERKLAHSPSLFLAGEDEGEIAGSVIAACDGHRGWINYLAVHPSRQGQGLGRALVDAAEERLRALGCPKVNLQVRTGTVAASAFYDAIGYERQELVDFGKRLVSDE